ncbi:MAG: transporter substrate-binding domain-containing protein [Bacillota bacterium]|nr:transporter substrate-binding domain-containing protein [Bacillota bacterium]
MKFRKVLPLLLIVAVVATIAVACAPKETAAPVVDHFASINAIKKAGKIVIGTSSGYFPFEMVDKNGKLIGFDIDLGNLIAKELGVKAEWKDIEDFTGLVPALRAGQLDLIIAGMTIKASRALEVNFTTPYFATGQAVLVNKDKVKGMNITKAADLDKAGVVISVSNGTTGHFAAERLFKKATIRVMDGSTTAGLEVLSGNATAMVFDLDWIAIYAIDNPAKTFALLEPLTVENLGIAVRPGQADLLYWLNTFLTEYVGNEDYMERYDYYFEAMPWKADMPSG